MAQDLARFLQIYSIVEILTAYIERELRRPASFGKSVFPRIFTLNEAVARKPFLTMTKINANPGVRSKQVYAGSRRSICVTRYGARPCGGNRPPFSGESIPPVLCRSIL